MHDQAAELRQLMQSFAQNPLAPVAAPRSVVVAGSLRGAGATTITVNLAAELTRHGRRIVLVDAETTGDATRLCRLHEPAAAHRSGTATASLADVLLGRRKLTEAISRAAHSIRVVANYPKSRSLTPTTDEIALLASEIATLGPEADAVLIDAGAGATNIAQQLAHTADLLLLVTNTTDAQVMETYASIKRIAATTARPAISVVFSRVETTSAAEDAFARLSHGCQKFLNIPINYAGCVLEDKTVIDAAACAAPFIVLSPRCDAARGLRQACEQVMAVLTQHGPSQPSERLTEPLPNITSEVDPAITVSEAA